MVMFSMEFSRFKTSQITVCFSGKSQHVCSEAVSAGGRFLQKCQRGRSITARLAARDAA